MKEILKRLFNHEELTREEACSLMKNITGEKYDSITPHSVPDEGYNSRRTYRFP